MISQASSALALFVLPLIFDMGCEDPTGAPKLACLLVAAGLACTQPRVPRSLPWLGLALWFGWSLVSALYNGYHAAWLPLLPIGAALLWALGEQQAMPWLALGWGGNVLYSWIQRLGMDPAHWNRPDLSMLRTIGGLANPNYLAMYLAALFPFMWTYLYARGWLARVAGFFSLSALFLTATRGSILALTVVLVLSTLVSKLRDKRFWLITWGLFLASWIFSLQISQQSRFSLTGQLQSLKRGAGDESVSARGQMWREAWRQGWTHPVVGVGPGHFGDHYLLNRPVEPESLRRQPRRPEDPHNEPLRVWCETGGVGLLLWLLWIGSALWRRREDRSAESACLLVLLANGMTNCYPVAVWPLLVLWTIPPVPERGRFQPLGVLVALTTLLAGVAGWVAQRAFWWDEDIKLYPQQTPKLQIMRVEWLGRVQKYSPPWYAEELAMRFCSAWQAWANTSGERSAWYSAELWARRRLQLNDQGAYAYSMLADVVQSQQRWPEAVRLWKEAVSRDPRNPAFHFFLARAHYLNGDWRSALASSQQSLEIYSKSSQVYQFRSQIMIDQGLTWEGYWDWVQSQQVRQGE